ncbi:MAG: hypothetical protein CL897_04000 [Dehalococcoidia bacterium]|nr:hypothetical protein [Dehalococcoidia bacterium]HCV00906.1 hypothetical protein [Dehalococcoidia bacterium]|tara:strand:+ start:2816 stop:4453 length:1638 start_codon:yes stop_codon:yes gene_type:complete
MRKLGRRIRRHPLTLLIAVLGMLALAAGSTSALVAPSESTGVSSLPVRVNAVLSPESRENTSVIVQNNSAKSTTIVMDFYTPAGVLIPLASQIHADVAAWSTRTFTQSLNQGLLPGFRGVGVLSSEQPLNALLLREVMSPGEIRSYAIHNAYAESGERVALPFVANQLMEGELGEILNTRFSIANAGLEVACVTITYKMVPGRGQTAANGSTTFIHSPGPSDVCPEGGIAIAVSGQLTIAPESSEMTSAISPWTTNSLMSVIIDSTQPVTVVADIFRGDDHSAQLGSYNGFVVSESESTQDDISKRMIIPLSQKLVNDYWTELAITNPWNVTASATITYLGKVTEDAERNVELAFDITVPAGSGITHSVLDSEDIPDGFIGWATVTADLPLAVVILRSKAAGSGDIHSYSAANGVPWEKASTTAKFPLIFRNAHAEGGAKGDNSWVSIAVEDGGTANIRLVSVNNPTSGAKGCGTLKLYQTTVTVSGSFFFDQGAEDKHKTGLGATPECLTGGMAIMSDKPIVALGGFTSDRHNGDNDALYNAFR